MVCVTIKRDARWVNDETVITIREAFQRAVVDVMKVKAEDVEVEVYDIGPLSFNSGRLAVEIDTGSGKDGGRIAACSEILVNLNEAVAKFVPLELRAKGKSNMWLRVFAKGASMPIGCPDQMH